MIISISGDPGSGKTSVGKILAKRLGYEFYSVGTVRGAMATQRGMTIEELNELGEHEAFTDTEVDDYQKKLGEERDNFVIEGRLSWHFIPGSFKIYLSCEEDESAQRVFKSRQVDADREDEPEWKSVEEAAESMQKRIASDKLRYQKYYGLDYRDHSNYDFVFDTTAMSGPEETADNLMQEIQKRDLLSQV